MIGLSHYVILSLVVFVLGIVGFLANTTNVILMLVSLEVMLLAAHINFIAYAAHHGDIAGQVFVVFILTTAAAEAAIALAILVMYFRGRQTIDIDAAPLLKETEA